MSDENTVIEQEVVEKAVSSILSEKLKGTVSTDKLAEATKGITDEFESRYKSLSDEVLEKAQEDIKAAIEAATVLKGTQETKREDRWNHCERNGWSFKGEMADLYRSYEEVMSGQVMSTKAITTVGSTAGSPNIMGTTYVSLDSENKFMQDINVQTFTGADTWIALNIGNLTLQKRANSGAALTAQGAGSETLNTFDLWEGVVKVSNITLDDVPQYMPSFEAAAGQADMKGKGTEIYKTIAASVLAGTAGTNLVQHKTANNTALPSDILDALSQMETAVGGQYRDRGVWHLSPAVNRALRKTTAGTNGDFAFNQETGVRELWGRPVRVNDRLPDGTTKNDVSAIFGDLRSAVTLGQRTGLEISWNPYISHGQDEMYIRSRFKAVIVDVGTASGPSACGLLSLA